MKFISKNFSMECFYQSGVLTITSDKKNIVYDPNSWLSIGNMEVALPWEYEKSWFLLISRVVTVPFDPIAVAHREMTKAQKEQDKLLQGLQDEENQDSTPTEEIQDEHVNIVPEIADRAKHMIHSINIEWYNILLTGSPIPERLLKDEHFASFIKKIDAVIATPSEDHAKLIALIDPRLTILLGQEGVTSFAKIGKTVESVSKWKSKESDFSSDDGICVVLVDESWE